MTGSAFKAFQQATCAIALGVIYGIACPVECSAQNDADASAQVEPPGCAPDAYPRRMPMNVKGVDGWWYHGEIARCLVAAYGQTLLLREELGLAEDQLRLRSARISRLDQSVRALDLQLLAAEARSMELREALAASEADRPSRVVWASLGAVAGVVVGAGLVALVVSSVGH